MIQTLVTGGTGFIGSSIVRKLVQNMQTVHVLTRNPESISRERRVPGAFYVKGDVFNKDSLLKAMEGCDALISTVQFDNAPFENPKKGLTYKRVDGEGTVLQMQALQESSISRVIYLSGAGTREGRIEPWFEAKWQAEQAVRACAKHWTIFRPSWIYGPQDQSLNKFIMFARFLPFIPMIGSGQEKIAPVYVEDVSNAVVKALHDTKTYEKVYDLGGPQLSMKEIIQTLLKVLGKRKLIVAHPKPIMKLIARLMQILPNPPLTAEGIDFVTMEESVDITFAREDLDFRPFNLKDGLKQYL